MPEDAITDPDYVWIQEAQITYKRSRNWFLNHVQTYAFGIGHQRTYVKRSEVEPEIRREQTPTPRPRRED